MCDVCDVCDVWCVIIDVWCVIIDVWCVMCDGEPWEKAWVYGMVRTTNSTLRQVITHEWRDVLAVMWKLWYCKAVHVHHCIPTGQLYAMLCCTLRTLEVCILYLDEQRKGDHPPNHKYYTTGVRLRRIEPLEIEPLGTEPSGSDSLWFYSYSQIRKC